MAKVNQDSLNVTELTNKNEKHVDAMDAEGRGGERNKKMSQTYNIKSKIYKRERQSTAKEAR